MANIMKHLHLVDDVLQYPMECSHLNHICLHQLQTQAISLGIQYSWPEQMIYNADL